MKIGTDDKRKLWWMVALLAIAIPLALYNFSSLFGSRSASASRAQAGQTKKPGTPLENLDPTPRLDILEASRKIKYEGGSRNIFRMEEVRITPPIAPPRPQQTAPPQTAYVPAPPPPINLKFYGLASSPGDPTKIFLMQGEDIFVAQEGDIINRRYKILQITATADSATVLVEDMLTGNRQPIQLVRS
ncbi:MAG TPA: hypothetical protein VEW69_12975 [Alphaproteobacteria bacterium]|nr:hypothetical protein [Alphaproteobacteria bacterium]